MFLHIFFSGFSRKMCLFVWVDVLWPSQPNWVMLSAVSLPNHTFTGQAWSSKRLTSIVHILLPETNNCPSWSNGRERIISWSPVGHPSNWVSEASRKLCCYYTQFLRKIQIMDNSFLQENACYKYFFFFRKMYNMDTLTPLKNNSRNTYIFRKI